MRRLPPVVVAVLVAGGLTNVGSTAARSTPIEAGPVLAATSSDWTDEVRAIVAGHPVSVSIGVDGTWLYRRRGDTLRVPASNEKLLLSMALLGHLDPDSRFPTRVETAARVVDGVVRGNLWIVGHGDPETDRFETSELANSIAAVGIVRVRGSVKGDTGPFARDDWAPGWKPYFPTEVVPLPTALTYEGNVDGSGRLIHDPERRAAAALTRQLENLGVHVGGDPGMGTPPDDLQRVATASSSPLSSILRHMDHNSINFDAEVLGKALGRLVYGAPGTIAKGAEAVEGFAARRDVSIVANDGSGLSYANRVTSNGIVRLLWFADTKPWAHALMVALPAGGQGTLEDRLTSVTVRAKTGTLDDISALSGWVWLERSGTWAQFSILSRGMSKDTAVRIENRVVRTVANDATAP